MILKPLCKLDLVYTELFAETLTYGEVRMYGRLEGQATGERVRGTVRASNYPVGRPDGVFAPHLRGVIHTDDEALLEIEMRGYGIQPDGDASHRRVVGFGMVRSGSDRYAWANRVMVAYEGVLESSRPSQAAALRLVAYEAAWEPLAGSRP